MIITNFIVSGLSWIFGKWVFGSTMCVIMTFFVSGFGMIGWLTITTMVVFKLHKLLYPLSTFITVERMKLFILSCWVITFLIPAAWSSPYAVRYFNIIGNCIFNTKILDHPLLFMIGSVLIILNFILLIASNCAILWIVKSRSRTGSIGKALRLILLISSSFLLSNILVVYMHIAGFLGSQTKDFSGVVICSFLLFQFSTFINPIGYHVLFHATFLQELCHEDDKENTQIFLFCYHISNLVELEDARSPAYIINGKRISETFYSGVSMEGY